MSRDVKVYNNDFEKRQIEADGVWQQSKKQKKTWNNFGCMTSTLLISYTHNDTIILFRIFCLGGGGRRTRAVERNVWWMRFLITMIMHHLIKKKCTIHASTYKHTHTYKQRHINRFPLTPTVYNREKECNQKWKVLKNYQLQKPVDSPRGKWKDKNEKKTNQRVLLSSPFSLSPLPLPY